MKRKRNCFGTVKTNLSMSNSDWTKITIYLSFFSCCTKIHAGCKNGFSRAKKWADDHSSGPKIQLKLLYLVGRRASGRVVGKICPGCISETVRCRKLILVRILVGGCRCATSRCDLDLTLP